MNPDGVPPWVDVADDTGQIRVLIGDDGVPRVELGIGVKSDLESLQFAGNTHVAVNRALGEYISKKLAQYRDTRARERAGASAARATELSVAERLDVMYERTFATQQRARAIRESPQRDEPISAGRRSRVEVEAQYGFVSALAVDEQFFAMAPRESLEQELNEALASTVMRSAVAGGPLIGLNTDGEERTR